MPHLIIVFVIFAVVIRFATLAISIRNQKRMLQNGAIEYDATTSRVLALAHIGFYVAAIAEGWWRSFQISIVTVVGLILYGLGICALFWVIQTLGRFWTVKVIIADDHYLITNPVFEKIRHPNYYLNIVPELIGFALALQAYAVLFIGFPVYAVVLVLRIRQEERAMRSHFEEY